MQLVGLQILVISTSIIAWIVICVSLIIQLPCFIKKRSTATFSVPILFTVWGMTTYALYETFFQCKEGYILSGFSCWSFALLIPLVYMYYRFRITGRIPDKQSWRRHWLLPGILAVTYLGMLFIAPSSDLQINGRSEFANDFPTRWSIFNILYNLSITALGAYVIWKLRLSSLVISKLKFDIPKLPQNTPTAKKTKRLLIPTEKQKQKIAFWLSPEMCRLKTNLQIIADDVMIERSDLSIYIRRLVGARYNVYANAMRLRFAEEMLLDENLEGITITELVERTGFQSNSTFYRAFSKRHRVSPLEWKKQVLENKENKTNS